MNLPDKLKIISMDYRVKEMAQKEILATDNTGACDGNDIEIRVGLDFPDQVTAQVFLHEILHAISHEMCIQEDMKDEEKIVQKMSLALCAVMRDNPDLFPLIQKSLNNK